MSFLFRTTPHCHIDSRLLRVMVSDLRGFGVCTNFATHEYESLKPMIRGVILELYFPIET